MEDSFEDYMDKDTIRLFERYKQEDAAGSLGFYDVDEYMALIDAFLWHVDFVKAKEVLQLAQRQYPQAVELKLKQAEICLEMDSFEQALQLLEEVEQVEPYLYDCHIVKGHTLLCMNRFDEARESFSRALEEGADEVDVAMGLARVEVEAHNSEKAWTYMQQIIGTEDDNIESCNRFIDLAQKGELLPQAIEFVRNLLKKHPYSLLYWKTLVELATAAACYEQALDACDFALAISPADWETYVNKFYLLEHSNAMPATHMDFYSRMEKLAIDRGEENSVAEIRLRKAQYYELALMWNEAEACYRQLLESSIFRPYALFRMGVVENFRQNYSLSLKYLQEALEAQVPDEGKVPHKANVYRGMARTYLNMDNTEEGMKYSRMAVEIEPENRVALYYYVRDAVTVGCLKEAYDYVCQQEKNTPEWRFSKAVLLYYMGQKENAYTLMLAAFEEDFQIMQDALDVIPGIVLSDNYIASYVAEFRKAHPGALDLGMGEIEHPFYFGPFIIDHEDDAAE